MKILISPAKQMEVEPLDLVGTAAPQFLGCAQQIYGLLQEMDRETLKKLWQCSDKLVAQNMARLAAYPRLVQEGPALLAYRGLQYQAMGATVFSADQLKWLNSRLLIGSGLYGLLRPLDLICPYRLEMGAKLEVEGSRLATFWKKQVKPVFAPDDLVLNLASAEYAKPLIGWLPREQVVNFRFATRKKTGKLAVLATFAKQGRGAFVRYLAETQATSRDKWEKFEALGFVYDKDLSSEHELVFVRTAD